MKQPLKSLLYLWVCLFAFACTSTREKAASPTTIILVRHAEKDTVGGNNPPLSIAGNARAKRLSAYFPKAKPDEFYATPFVRTISTLKPWAKSTGKDVKTYAAADSIHFVETLLNQKGKTIVVAGHSNTIPALVNRLIGTNKYQPLHDTAYSNIYVVTISKEKVADKIVHY